MVLSRNVFHVSDHPCYPLSLMVLLVSFCKEVIGMIRFCKCEPFRFLVTVIGFFCLFFSVRSVGFQIFDLICEDGSENSD